jgi:protein-L-isoaspartate(D-aspartate) O-methyltransferase
MIDFQSARQAMVDSQLRARGISDARVLDAMARVPRHEFVSEPYQAEAYQDHPLPIGDGQTISQPYVVAVMLELLQISLTDVVLEVGTGSGYVTALLSRLASEVFSIERHSGLAANAGEILSRLGYNKVEIFTADGAQGLASHAPFDAILVSAAALHVPPALIAQLRDGGRMVLPVGSPEVQELQLIRAIDGRAEITRREAVRFVPLITDASGQR